MVGQFLPGSNAVLFSSQETLDDSLLRGFTTFELPAEGGLRRHAPWVTMSFFKLEHSLNTTKSSEPPVADHFDTSNTKVLVLVLA